MKILAKEEIAAFFSKRTWLRPSDYEAIVRGNIRGSRLLELSAFCCGYLNARPRDVNPEPGHDANPI